MRLLKIGRDAGCDITLNSPRVSSLHAELTLLNSGDILLEDKGSLNGTFVQNRRLQPGKSVNIRRGDAVRFGDIELQWSQIPVEDNTGYRGVWGIGSDFHNDFQVAGATVSRFHATVKQSNDKKFYIIDHSKNGTTVDGRKIIPHSLQRIKKNNAIACGGVPVDLKMGNKIPWPSDMWKIILASAASLLLLVGIGYGINSIITSSETDTSGLMSQPQRTDTIMCGLTDQEIYNKYNHSLVMLMGIHHFEINIDGIDKDAMKIINSWLPSELRIPEKFIYFKSKKTKKFEMIPATDVSKNDYIDYIIKETEGEGLSSATGFFVSNDGKLVTNLHVVKPWLFYNDDKDNIILLIQTEVKHRLAVAAKSHENDILYPYLIAGMTDVKVSGVLDKLALISQGETFDMDNIKNCRVLSAGEDKNKDVALIQISSKSLPTSDCSYVDLPNEFELSEDSLSIGSRIYTMGFPMGNAMQKEARGDGIKVISQNGTISQKLEFDFMHNASTTGGMSGSPIFNRYGKLIGVHHAGYSQSGLQGFNYGVKAKYVKELLDNPHKK